MMQPTVLEICAGGGGQALGLEQAGFASAGAVEIDATACTTLRANRPSWNVIEGDLRAISGKEFTGVDLLAGGVPCPPFSIAGKQLGKHDERDLFPEAIRLIRDIKPRAVMLENVPGFAQAKFAGHRAWIREELAELGYEAEWCILQAADYGVPQLRPRFILIALKPLESAMFHWPKPQRKRVTVGECLHDLMGANAWEGVDAWARKACDVAPTLVGGSKKHGGADLGPSRARARWKELGVIGLSLADEAPGYDFPPDGLPRLTLQMVSRIQGFPDEWKFIGKKTAAYRQVGNALPPPVAKAVGSAILSALSGRAAEWAPPLPFAL